MTIGDKCKHCHYYEDYSAIHYDDCPVITNDPKFVEEIEE